MWDKRKEDPRFNEDYHAVRELSTLCDGAFHMLAKLYPRPDRSNEAQTALEDLHKACSALERLLLKEKE